LKGEPNRPQVPWGDTLNGNATLTDIYEWCQTWGGDPVAVVGSILEHESADLVGLGRVAGAERVEDAFNIV